MLARLCKELEGEKIAILDDGSDYDPKDFLKHDYYRFPHGGKMGFWKIWDYALEICEESDDDWFLFLADDFYKIDLDKIRQTVKGLSKYCFNIANIGADRGWVPLHWIKRELNKTPCYKVGFVDGFFCCDRKALDAIGWGMEPVSPLRFVNPNISSGVGQQLSKRFFRAGVPVYMPEKSMAFHGDHPSLMHPEERKKNKLIAK